MRTVALRVKSTIHWFGSVREVVNVGKKADELGKKVKSNDFPIFAKKLLENNK